MKGFAALRSVCALDGRHATSAGLNADGSWLRTPNQGDETGWTLPSLTFPLLLSHGTRGTSYEIVFARYSERPEKCHSSYSLWITRVGTAPLKWYRKSFRALSLL